MFVCRLDTRWSAPLVPAPGTEALPICRPHVRSFRNLGLEPASHHGTHTASCVLVLKRPHQVVVPLTSPRRQAPSSAPSAFCRWHDRCIRGFITCHLQLGEGLTRGLAMS